MSERAEHSSVVKVDTNANLMCLIASSSGRTQSCHSGEPYDMHPRMILDTFNPEFPRRTVYRVLLGAFRSHVRNARQSRTILHLGGHREGPVRTWVLEASEDSIGLYMMLRALGNGNQSRRRRYEDVLPRTTHYRPRKMGTKAGDATLKMCDKKRMTHSIPRRIETPQDLR